MFNDLSKAPRWSRGLNLHWYRSPQPPSPSQGGESLSILEMGKLRQIEEMVSPSNDWQSWGFLPVTRV